MKELRIWCESEIESMMDLYGNTRAQAIEFVIDLLTEGEYEELNENQVSKAISYLRQRA